MGEHCRASAITESAANSGACDSSCLFVSGLCTRVSATSGAGNCRLVAENPIGGSGLLRPLGTEVMSGNRTIARGVCRLVLVRHAIAEGDGRFQGQRNVPLTLEGRRQLRELVRKLSRYPIRAAYSSDLRRARATAEAAACEAGVKLEMRRGLREMHFGC